MFKRVKYISRFTRDLRPAEIDALVKQAAHNNAGHGITGIMMTVGGMFFQVIEGPPEAIDLLYRNITADSRHTDVLLLATEENAPQRLFPEWSMHRIDLEHSSSVRLEPMREVLQAVVNLRAETQRLTSLLERAAWQELVNPDSGEKS